MKARILDVPKEIHENETQGNTTYFILYEVFMLQAITADFLLKVQLSEVRRCLKT